MEKKVSITGMYETTYSGDVFVGKLSTPTKIGLTDQTKVALLEYMTESDDFHKLVCDITGVERKQEKVFQELEKLKEDYSHMCENYEHEKQKRNDFIRLYKEENAKRLEVERGRDCQQKHYKFIMDEITSMLKEVECGSVRGIVDVLKAERANGKLLAEENELCRREYDKLKEDYGSIAESHEHLNKCNQNQAKTITSQMNDIVGLRNKLAEQMSLAKKYMAKSEKLQSKLDKASKRYGELIKTISDRAIK